MLVKVEFESQDGKNLEPTYYALADFVTCIREGKRPFSNVETGKTSAITAHLGNLAMET